ncbi:hypothetical protein CDAR_382011 [Caerostris darwini]|uniref:Uncharacterized protein n=1 Tax=Caerostris darwini TaxID=1538125 RepID=A0AAV4V4Z3_9ARAC|nr:hypothetical protein CDAR_382011 [Caerostris darwini]
MTVSNCPYPVWFKRRIRCSILGFVGARGYAALFVLLRSLVLLQGKSPVQDTDFQESDITPLGWGLDPFLEKTSSEILFPPAPPPSMESSEYSPSLGLLQETRRLQATDFLESDITPLGLGLGHL